VAALQELLRSRGAASQDRGEIRVVMSEKECIARIKACANDFDRHEDALVEATGVLCDFLISRGFESIVA
jgi:hypothetical protein